MLAFAGVLGLSWQSGVRAQEGDGGALDAGRASVAADAGGASAPVSAGVELVFPRNGATGVMTNPGLLLRLDGAILAPSHPWQWPPEPPALGEGLLLRDPAGGLIVAGPLVTLETARALGEDRPAANAHVEVATPALELGAGVRYEVLTRLAVCAADAGRGVACLQDQYRVFVTHLLQL